MFDCPRCKSTGRVTEQYVDHDLGPPVLPDVPLKDMVVEVKTRVVECPWCFGFSAVPLRPKSIFEPRRRNT